MSRIHDRLSYIKENQCFTKYFWSVSFESIYPTSNGLEREQLVTKSEITQNGREKIFFPENRSIHITVKLQNLALGPNLDI